MTLKIRSLKNIVEDNGIKILIHGPAGSGKTVMCCTAGEPTLMISAESGLLSVRDAPSYVKGAEVKTLGDIEEVYDYLLDSQDEPDFSWVALDSITEIAETVLAYEKKQSKDPRKAYGQLQEHMMELIKKFRDLRGYNVVMSCKQQRISDDDGPTFYAPMMPGAKLHQQLPYLFDEIFALRVETDEDKEEYRVVQTGRDAKYEAKDRSNCLDMFEPPNLKKIAEKIGVVLKNLPGKKPSFEEPVEEVEERVEPEEQVEEQEQEIETAKAKHRMYWIHPESSSAGVLLKGDEIIDENQGVEYVSGKDYEKFCEANGIEI